MNNLCPRCRASRKDEAVIASLVTVWFSCTRCECVWRGSILQFAVGCVRRGVGLPIRSSMEEVKIQTEARPLTTNAPYDLEVSTQLGELEGALAKQNNFGDGIKTSDDEAMTEDVASWLGEQEAVKHSPETLDTVDNLIEMMDAQTFKIADARSPLDASRRPIADAATKDELTSSARTRRMVDVAHASILRKLGYPLD